ncbi:MAG: peptidase T [Gemmataceae bacterium]
MKLETPTLLDRFVRYCQVDTQADERAKTYPSSPGQLVLGRMLRDELLEMGYSDARQTEYGIVIATIPATVNHPTPTVAFNAHVDTSPETSGHGVKPQVIRNYDGSDIVLPGDTSKVIRTADSPELKQLIGKTIITTDGTTLLGSDDKSGVAVIMELARILAKNNEIPHGKLVVCFTCDEEIGKGVQHLEPADLGADVAYTLDGAGSGEIDIETFSADRATVTITGVNIHPSIAKGRMVNAVKVASAFLDRLPKGTLSPESTANREPFIHPYTIEGGVGQTTIHCLLRTFDTPQLSEQAELLRTIARETEASFPHAKVQVEIVKQYRNMKDGIAREPRAIPHAIEAMKRVGITAKLNSIRGGTDGALLTAKGLPTPNLSTGEHNFHSPLEWTCLEEMETAVAVLVELVKVWAE